jgi:hypothetical protein
VEALRIKPCWTEPLVTRANLASSMGIVKRNALETKLVREHQVLGPGRAREAKQSVGKFVAGESAPEARKAFARGRRAGLRAD